MKTLRRWTRSTAAILLPLTLLGLLLAGPWSGALAGDAAAPPERAAMSAGQAALLGVVEGLTEYLLVSSTAHLLLTQRLMGIGRQGAEKTAADSYGICIQAGAILAVLWLYFGRVKSVFAGLLGRDPQGRQLLINLVAAFVPAAVIGLLFEKSIKHYLFGLGPIVIAWFVGGVAILLVTWLKRNQGPRVRNGLDDLVWQQAIIIGFAQCLAMWPGVSRSLITIVGGLLVGLSLTAAVEFSFLLGLMTLGAATSYEAIKDGRHIIAIFGWLNPLLGFLTSFISGVAAVKWMVGYLNRHGLAIFGYYRVALALVVGALYFQGLI